MTGSRIDVLRPAVLAMLLALGAVLAGLLPLAMPGGLAAGGVLETGQAEPARWWLGMTGAAALYLLVSRKWNRASRLWWLAVLIAAMTAGVYAFAHVASSDQPRGVPEGRVTAERGAPPLTGVLTALPLFWPEGRGVDEIVAGARNGGGIAPVTRHPMRAIDHLDAAALRGIDSLLVAQPRLLQPEELVVLDHWISAGGRALIFADPLLVWPGDLPPGDPRRAPLTSLLDPLLAHWGLRLEPAAPEARGIERRMLGTGHVVILARASRFTSISRGARQTHCRLTEGGLMALCRAGRGQVRLIADADLLDERLWLADPYHPGRSEAWSADIPALVDAWLTRPLEDPAAAAPRRVAGEAALVPAMRAALAAIFLAGVLGWAVPALARRQSLSRNGKVKGTEAEQKSGRTKK